MDNVYNLDSLRFLAELEFLQQHVMKLRHYEKPQRLPAPSRLVSLPWDEGSYALRIWQTAGENNML